jgi:putative oxidoreductase
MDPVLSASEVDIQQQSLTVALEKSRDVSVNAATHDYGVLLLRISLGTVFLAHTGLKIFVFTLPGTAMFFEHHGFPGWAAYPVTLAEALGGLMLITGFHARWAALLLAGIMTGATSVHIPNGWAFTNPNGGWEYPAFLIAASFAQFLLGDGKFSWDPLAGKRQ